MLIGLIGWILVGLAVGYLVSRVMNLHGDDPRMGIGVATAGAFVAAFAYTRLAHVAIAPFDLWSLLYAAIGAGVAVAAWHVVRSRFVSREPYTRRSSY